MLASPHAESFVARLEDCVSVISEEAARRDSTVQMGRETIQQHMEDIKILEDTKEELLSKLQSSQQPTISHSKSSSIDSPVTTSPSLSPSPPTLSSSTTISSAPSTTSSSSTPNELLKSLSSQFLTTKLLYGWSSVRRISTPKATGVDMVLAPEDSQSHFRLVAEWDTATGEMIHSPQLLMCMSEAARAADAINAPASVRHQIMTSSTYLQQQKQQQQSYKSASASSFSSLTINSSTSSSSSKSFSPSSSPSLTLDQHIHSAAVAGMYASAQAHIINLLSECTHQKFLPLLAVRVNSILSEFYSVANEILRIHSLGTGKVDVRGSLTHGVPASVTFSVIHMSTIRQVTVTIPLDTFIPTYATNASTASSSAASSRASSPSHSSVYALESPASDCSLTFSSDEMLSTSPSISPSITSSTFEEQEEELQPCIQHSELEVIAAGIMGTGRGEQASYSLQYHVLVLMQQCTGFGRLSTFYTSLIRLLEHTAQ